MDAKSWLPYTLDIGGKHMTAKLKLVKQVLGAGGKVQFDWKTCTPWLVNKDGDESMRMDGRTYQSFLDHHSNYLVQTETGSTETRDLVITWRQTARRMLTVYVENQADADALLVLLVEKSSGRKGIKSLDWDTNFEDCQEDL
jgi:hypothetical protein